MAGRLNQNHHAIKTLRLMEILRGHGTMLLQQSSKIVRISQATGPILNSVGFSEFHGLALKLVN